MVKKKVLVVVNSLWRAGGEKYAFELISHLQNEHLDFEVLTSLPADKDTDGFANYYVGPLQERGVKIHRFLKKTEFEIHIQSSLLKRITDSFLYRTGLIQFLRKHFHRKRALFFSEFDGILLIGTIMLPWVQKWVNPSTFLETHLISFQIQEKENLYKDYLEDRAYNFAFMDRLQLLEAQKSGVTIQSEFHCPLSIDFSSLQLVQHERDAAQKPIVIAVFTRINRDKSIEPILEAFEKIQSMNEKVILHIYGKILDQDYYQILLKRIEQNNGMAKVYFKGHCDNMVEQIKNDDIRIIWNLSVFDVVGFATLELAASACPIICYNVYDKSEMDKPVNNSSSLPPYFNNPNELAHFTNEIIANNRFSELSKREFNFFKEKHNSANNLQKYKEHLMRQLKSKTWFEKI